MRSFVSIVLLFFSATSFAQTSTYQYQPEQRGNTAEVLMTRGTGSFRAPSASLGGPESVQSDILQLNVKGSIDENFKYSGGLAFIKRQYSSNNDSYSVAGLGDLNTSVWTSTDVPLFMFDSIVTLNYGADLSLSIAPARYESTPDRNGDPAAARWRKNNSG
jgi:hypothetical protein